MRCKVHLYHVLFCSKRLSLVHTRTFKMDEDVLCVKHSPDHKLIAASLLDNTVKVFFADTLKVRPVLQRSGFPWNIDIPISWNIENIVEYL